MLYTCLLPVEIPHLLMEHPIVWLVTFEKNKYHENDVHTQMLDPSTEMQCLSAATGDFENRSEGDYHKGDTPRASESPPDIQGGVES